MISPGLSDSIAGVSESPANCRQCGATTRLGNGLCLSCTLREGLEDDCEASSESFQAILAEDEVRDTQWRIGNYEILEEIGRGGMGVIYRARQRHSRRIVALKRIVSYHADSRETLERFRREAEAAASLDHPNILPIYEVGQGEDALPFFSMKYAAGGSLQKAGPALRGEPRECVRLMTKVARAVQYAHEHGVLHRDLKPGNILLDGRGEPFVTDFGLAKWLDTTTDLTRTLAIFGTPGYIAPEQAKGAAAKLTPAADVYSLGAILFDLFTGRPPFLGEHALAVIQQATDSPAPKLRSVAPTLDRDLETICARCLDREPQARYRSAGDLAIDLERWLEGRPIIARRVSPPVRTWRWVKRNPKLAAATAAAFCSAAAAAFLFFSHTGMAPQSELNSTLPSEKSIAVLPFENLSRDPDNAYFAEGIQDEILTRLSKIADLKVISRTSTQHYKSAPENLPEIARQLGVANILEGSVQKSGNSVRVNVQLIKAASDSHLWADTFDRKLTDVLSVESEVAKAIADQLRAKLTGQEEQVIAAKPTENPEAYDAYLRGLAYSLKPANTTANSLGAQKYLRQAVRLDPKFALAWALLSSVDSVGYLTKTLQPTVALREEARQAAETASSLRPDLGEALMAVGYYHYGCLKDYDTAIRYFEQARQILPNDSRIPESLAYVTRRRGQWERSETYFNEAERLDPRNANLLTQHAVSYMRLRRFPEALRKLDQVLNITPDDVRTVAFKAGIAQAQGDLPRAAALLAPLHPNADDAGTLETQVYQAILERRPAAIIPRLEKILEKPDPELGYFNSDLRFWLGWAQDLAGDHVAAQKSWRQARSELELFLKEQPDNFNVLTDLALTNMGLGDKDAALAFAERAIAANPIEKDAISGPSGMETLARVAAQMGEPDRAIDALRNLLSIPAVTDTAAPFTPALLRLDPMFDPIRNDSRFQELVAPVGAALSAPAQIPEKSIAVLPFENRSSDPDNAFFTDGVQDEILTDLARIADLKVISRTSVMQYKTGAKRNLRQIGNELGVAHVVEGSVQRAGNRVRVNAQLIDARTDAHLWAQTYDRDLADVFAIQSEIAKAIADQLKAKLSPSEKSAIEQPPTTDITAFNLYSHAKNLFLTAFGGNNGADLLQAADLLKQAVARDPSFFQAYCQLAFTEINIYGVLDHTPEHLEQAEAALQSAARLRPDAGETHLARARNLYWGYLDYDGALRELEIARQSLPGEDWIFSLKGYIERRQGRWEECIHDLERATELDPRNVLTLQQLALTYQQLRRYAEEKSTFERILAFQPNDPVTKSMHAFVELDSKANTRPLREVTDSIRDKNPAALSSIADNWLLCALAERDPAAARKALIALGENSASLGPLADVRVNRPFMEGIIATIAKDNVRAQAAFTAARAEQTKIVQAQPNYGPALCVLGLIDAGLGRKEDALREGRRAVELLPVEKDALNGPAMIKYLAMIAAWVGEKELACQQLDIAMRRPSSLSYGQLKLLPFWDPLRGDSRFEKIVEQAKEPVATAVPAKSIAVLPFENLSEEKANAYFAAGVQDEILTRLAGVRDLKVISRTSTAKYQSKPDNLKRIAQELGVSTILEGTVQKAGDKVRVNVQLIDARADTHLWAKSYDRDLNDVLKVESEVSREIAEALQANLSPSESHVLTAARTQDAEAYDLFLRGEYEFYQAEISPTAEAYDRADAFYRQALARDPNFAEAGAGFAYCRLSRHWNVSPLAPAELEEVKSLIDRALALAPNSPQAHLALGLFFYWAHRQYEMALAEFNRTLELQPNNALARQYCAWVYRRRGEWERSLADSQRAQELDPRDAGIPSNIGETYLALRLWKDAERAELRALAINPHHAAAALALLYSRLNSTGDVDSARRALDGFPEAIKSVNLIRRGGSVFGDVGAIIGNRVYLDVIKRRFTDAFQEFEKGVVNDYRAHLQQLAGRAALHVLAGQTEAAKSAGDEALPLLEARLRERPDDIFAVTELSWVYLALGRNDDALRLSRQAADTISIEKDAVTGPYFQNGLAQIEARAGAPVEAIKRLRRLLSIPAGWDVSIARLKIDPVWDPIRNRPDFQQLLSGPEQIGPNK